MAEREKITASCIADMIYLYKRVEGVGFEPTKTYVGRFTVCCL
jgi:hypothetical protein